MSKITIREVDETTVGNVVIESTDVVYVPGFSVLNQTDDEIIGEPHVPKLCRTISEFETYFGALTPTFSMNQSYPQGFSSIALPPDTGGTAQDMFKKDDPDPSYIYAKELLAAGLPVLYERVNEVGETISVSKMYSALGTVFNKKLSAETLSIFCVAPPYDETATYAVDAYCSHDGKNYQCTTAITGSGEEWNPAHWKVATDYESYNVSVSSIYTFYDMFYESGQYTFTYEKYPNRTLTCSATLAGRMAPVYDSKKSYALNDHCTYSEKVFTCIKATTGGEFDSSCWTLSTDFTPSSFVTFDEDVWNASYPVDNTSYVFKYSSTSNGWVLNDGSSTVNLQSLGIKTAGEFNNNDTITIANNFNPAWVLKSDGMAYNLTECGITLTAISGRTNQYGDTFTVYFEAADPLLLDRGLYSFKYLTSGGYPVFEYDYNSIGKSMANLCATRGDAVALIDHTDNPSRSLTGATSVYFVAKNTSNMIPTANQSFAAMFTPAVEMGLVNQYRGWSWKDSVRVKLPGSCVLPASFAYLSCLASAIKIFPNWNAIAGATRGKVAGLIAPRTVKALTNAIADSYTPDTELAINPITNIRPYGQCIWGNRTLVDNSAKQGTTATSFLNIRNLVSDVKKQLFVACQSLLFEQNTDVLWVNFLSLVTPILDKMVSGFGIHTYKIIKLPNSDKTQINVKIRLYPIYAVESFDITIYLNDEGVYLDGEE